MTDRIKFDRRVLIGGAAITGLAALLYGGAVGRGAMKQCGIAIDRTTEATLAPLIRIGETYLAQANVDLDALYARVNTGSLANVEASLRKIADEAESEFARGDVVTVDGWMLAKSEASFCALAALNARRLHLA